MIISEFMSFSFILFNLLSHLIDPLEPLLYLMGKFGVCVCNQISTLCAKRQINRKPCFPAIHKNIQTKVCGIIFGTNMYQHRNKVLPMGSVFHIKRTNHINQWGAKLLMLPICQRMIRCCSPCIYLFQLTEFLDQPTFKIMALIWDYSLW